MTLHAKGFLRFSLAIALALAPTPGRAADAVAGDWAGQYVYGWTGGKNPGMVVDYDLEVPPAILAMEGFQTDETLYCDVESTTNRLVLKFRSYDDGNTVNKYGVAVYAPGATLLVLEKAQSGGKERLLTTWKGVELPNGTHPKPGVYFRRADEDRKTKG